MAVVEVDGLAQERPVSSEDTFLMPSQEVATFYGLETSAERRIEVTLHKGDEVVDSFAIFIAQDSDQTVTVGITRSCEAVGCSAGQRCLSHQCVDWRCVDGGQDACPNPECETESDCTVDPSAAECVTPVCFRGVCYEAMDNSSCEAGEQCDAQKGCVPSK